MKWLERTEMLIGMDAMLRLSVASVAIFGIGGVGSFAAEAIARSGVGRMLLVDNDVVSISNINRQLIATRSTIGKNKAQLMKDRIGDINPDAEVSAIEKFYHPDNSFEFDIDGYDYIVDAIDTVTSKIELIIQAKACGVPIISALGAGNKMNSTMFEVADIYSTSICPLARVMRRELKKRGIESLKVVYSKEKPIKPLIQNINTEFINDERINGEDRAKRQIPGSMPFVPPVCGMIIASQVIKDLINTG